MAYNHHRYIASVEFDKVHEMDQIVNNIKQMGCSVPEEGVLKSIGRIIFECSAENASKVQQLNGVSRVKEEGYFTIR